MERQNNADGEQDDVIKNVSGMAYAGKYQYFRVVNAVTHDGRPYQVGRIR